MADADGVRGMDHRDSPPGDTDPGVAPQAGDDIVVRFAQLALELHGSESINETVETVVQFALQAVRCSHAGVALVGEQGQPEVSAVTSPIVAEDFRAQTTAADGPLVESMRSHTTVLVADTATEQRWPAWAAKARAAGVRSVLDVPLSTTAETVGVLGLYSLKPNAFGPDDEAIAHMLAMYASVAVATARNERNLTRAVDARTLVGQATGILMERYSMDEERAFAVLKRYSQHTNTKLRDVAQQLIDTRHLPE
ncbi:GAF and ANTAR domain-containing protein [Kribbella sp. NPDC049227]|uniref:GAF and ANTAR domain-containing protein n=1 Tax=Kribbella sp. NPDC049227 TaxID=3364113 RepID=UPI00371AE0C8